MLWVFSLFFYKIKTFNNNNSNNHDVLHHKTPGLESTTEYVEHTADVKFQENMGLEKESNKPITVQGSPAGEMMSDLNRKEYARD